MKRRIGIITVYGDAGVEYQDQLRQAVGNTVEVELYSLDKGTVRDLKPAELYLFSKGAIGSCTDQKLHLPPGIPVLDIDVDFTAENMRQLAELPPGSKALFVNATEFLVRECITRIQQLGVSNLELVPYYPGLEPFPPLPLAVTAGDGDLIPPCVKQVVDLGSRRLTPQVIVEIALSLQMKDVLESREFLSYAAQFDNTSYAQLHKSLRKSFYLEDCFEVFVESIDQGVIGADENGRIFCVNHKAAEILEKRERDLVGALLPEQIPFLPLSACKERGIPVENAVEKLESGYISYSLRPILRGGRFEGAFLTLERFAEAEEKQQEVRRQVLNKGHVAKYRFENILGESQALVKTKELARQMAKTDFTILICGESGTGKELFASAIHNASRRADYPFVAINCAAMPETLLESELFGYEDGAFTGAKKGGRLGLFEFAHGGTMFLDEIEAMSPALQAKLLRVLQEREVMRLGGNRMIRIDVRVVAASNENLEESVNCGTFRKDLYYRLSTLPIQLPTLKERREDILLLFNYFRERYQKNFSLGEPVKRVLLEHSWDGNVRELQNYIEYFICLNKEEIGLEDLPVQLARSGKPAAVNRKPDAVHPEGDTEKQLTMLFEQVAGRKPEACRFLLAQLLDCYESRCAVGRSALLRRAEERDLFITEQEIRTILSRLQEKGLVTVSRGRSGTRLTALGRQMAQIIGQ